LLLLLLLLLNALDSSRFPANFQARFHSLPRAASRCLALLPSECDVRKFN
jgi:hypothetical protein